MPSHWTEIHTDVPLSNFSLAYRNESFIADLICPPVPVGKKSDKYYIYGTEDIKLIDTLRANKTASKGITRSVSTTTYFCNGHALHELVDDDDRGNADPGIDPELDAVDGCMESLMIAKESEIATLFTTEANYSSSSYYETLTSGDQWNDPGYTSDPIGKVSDAKKVVQEGCLRPANAMIVPYAVGLALEKHPAVVDYLKHTGGAVLTQGTEQLAAKLSNVFGLQVFIAVAAYDATREGQTGHTFTQLWSDYCVIFYLNRAASLKSMAFAKNFSYGMQRVDRITQPDLGKGCDKIEVNLADRDPKIICNTAAYLFEDTLI